jgi:hypothetical protein
MGLRNPRIFRWTPQGLTDNAAPTAPGYFLTMRNMFLDPSSVGVLLCRSASTQVTNFTGFSSPGIISVFAVIGTRIYGMIATSRNSGHDEPFCYDTSLPGFVTVSNVLSTNTPNSPSTGGQWSPPAMALVGTKLVVTHSGFGGTSNYFGWFDLSNPAAPAWNAGNTTGAIILSAVPTTCGMFYNRAWYAVKNTVVFSDSLNAINVTNAGQALTIGDTTAVNGIVPQPMTTGTQGILGALLLFKSQSIWQVTGDYALSNLVLNELTGSVGCAAQRSMVPTPVGTMFMATDGIRSVNLAGTVSEPLPNVVLPFYNCNPNSRVCAAYASDTYRISVDTLTTDGLQGRYEYWFGLKTGQWSGPHDFPSSCIAAMGGSNIICSNAAPGLLFTGNTYQTGADTFTENGNTMTIFLNTSIIDTPPGMSEKATMETSVLAAQGVQEYTAQVTDQFGNQLGSALITPSPSTNTWDEAGLTWDEAGLYWGLGSSYMAELPVYFSSPIVFKLARISFSGNSSAGVRIGYTTFRYEALGYTGP